MISSFSICFFFREKDTTVLSYLGYFLYPTFSERELVLEEGREEEEKERKKRVVDSLFFFLILEQNE